ncbi:MAG: 4Fe-4S binding protein [Deltaproteobacteria bacterium]|nr:4Fe-4S binding protein [Deltaproteobacteria bacterium]
MLANYGYKDGSGDFFITLDTDKCDGCGDCVTACPNGVFEVVDEDPNDPMREEPVMDIRSQNSGIILWVLTLLFYILPHTAIS